MTDLERLASTNPQHAYVAAWQGLVGALRAKLSLMAPALVVPHNYRRLIDQAGRHLNLSEEVLDDLFELYRIQSQWEMVPEVPPDVALSYVRAAATLERRILDAVPAQASQ